MVVATDATCAVCGAQRKCQIFDNKIVCLGCLNEKYACTSSGPAEPVMPQAGKPQVLGPMGMVCEPVEETEEGQEGERH